MKESISKYHIADEQTSSENMAKGIALNEIAFAVPTDERKLFRTAGFAWKHKEEEENFLKELCALKIT
jgi:hypothetical protein